MVGLDSAFRGFRPDFGVGMFWVLWHFGSWPFWKRRRRKTEITQLGTGCHRLKTRNGRHVEPGSVRREAQNPRSAGKSSMRRVGVQCYGTCSPAKCTAGFILRWRFRLSCWVRVLVMPTARWTRALDRGRQQSCAGFAVVRVLRPALVACGPT